jgi:hypothetical protein
MQLCTYLTLIKVIKNQHSAKVLFVYLFVYTTATEGNNSQNETIVLEPCRDPKELNRVASSLFSSDLQLIRRIRVRIPGGIETVNDPGSCVDFLRYSRRQVGH